jgi:hypothetical protein
VKEESRRRILNSTTHVAKEQTTLYASGADFCRIFAEDMNNLYLLSLLLTADEEKAEQCFVAGLDDCANGNQVFQEWAHSWARRAIIKNAVRLLEPQPRETGSHVSGATKLSIDESRSMLRAEMSAVLELPAFERFVLVMSVLEGYSDRECALLLGCTRDSVIAGRIRALQRFGRTAARASAEDRRAVLAPIAPLATAAVFST